MSARRYLLLLAYCIGFGGCWAVEADPATVARNQAKTTWIDAAKVGDIWGCLQLEEWGRDQKPPLRLGPILGSSIIHGSTLFAAPEKIHLAADFGDRIVMSISRRTWVLAPDGRPLQPAVTLATHGSAQAVSWDGTIIASGRRIGGQREINASAMRLSDGKTLLRGVCTIPEESNLEGINAVADDGSAIAVTVSHDNRPRQIFVMMTKDGDPLRFPNSWTAFGVGRNGAWVGAHTPRGEVLLRGTERIQIGNHCVGPGMLACIVQDKPILVLPDGKDIPLSTGRAVGTHPAMTTTGGWLALITGKDAQGVSSGGLMGDDEGKAIDLPVTVLLWRWADLAANPASPPTETLVGHAWTAADRASTLWFWNGKDIDELDLSGARAVRKPYLQASDTIGWAWTSGHCLIIRLEAGHYVAYGPDKALMWDGKCDSIWVKRPDLAVTRRVDQGDIYSYQLQTLAADAAARKEVPLPVPPIEQSIEVEFRRNDNVVAGPASNWQRFDTAGTFIDKGGDSRPTVHEWDVLPGRFYRENARLLRKDQPYPTDFDDQLMARDAWRVGPVEILLDQDHNVYGLTKGQFSRGKRAGWTLLGNVPRADHLAMVGPNPVVTAYNDAVLASFVAGPTLNRKQISGMTSTPFASGPWRINDMDFIPPRNREVVWDENRVGFSPSRLRGPDDGSMLVITSSVMIEFDVDAVRLVGRSP